MNTSELLQIEYRYVKIKLENYSMRYENTNFTNLLEYIGKPAYPQGGEKAIGSAYRIIRSETDKLLRASRFHNRKLMTSKNEVKSIRFSKYAMCEKKNNHQYIRIPYKICYIFTAIINIVAEISKENPIPESLQPCVNKAYSYSFYALHISEYNKAYYRSFREDALVNERYINPAKLHPELNNATSVLNQIFVGSEEIYV